MIKNGFDRMVRKVEKELKADDVLLSEAFLDMISRFINGVIKVERAGKTLKLKMQPDPDPESVAYTNDSEIVIFLYNCFYQTCKSKMEKFMLTIGLIAHELGHCFFTSFPTHKRWIKAIDDNAWFPKEPRLKNTIDLNHMGTRKYIRWLGSDINNCLEDGFVEAQMKKIFPGMMREALTFVRKVSFNESPFLEEAIEAGRLFAAMRQGILNYATSGDYKFRDKDSLDDQGQLVLGVLNQAKPLIDSYEKASNNGKWQICNDLVALLWDYRNEEPESEEQQPGEGEEQSGGGQPSSSEPAPPKEGNEENEASEESKQAGESNPQTGEDEEDEGNGAENQSGEPSSSEEGPGEPQIPESMEALEGSTARPERLANVQLKNQEELENTEDMTLEEIMKTVEVETAIEEVEKTMEQNGNDEIQGYGDGLVQYIKPGSYRQRTMTEAIRNRLKNAEATGNKIARQIERYMKVETQSGNKRGLYTGKLNRNGLMRRDQKIFMRQGAPEKEINMAVLILIDRSGSTNGGLDYIMSESAAVLHALFEKLNIPVMMQGYRSEHCCQEDNSFEVYGTFTGALKLSRQRMMLSVVEDYYFNRDGYFFRNATKLLKQREEEVKLCIILSDGKPNDGGRYSGTAAEKDTIQAVMDMRQKGIRPIVAGVGRDAKKLQEMYGGEIFLDVSDPRQLSQKLSRVIQKVIKTNV